jgi:hypothetical protein
MVPASQKYSDLRMRYTQDVYFLWDTSLWKSCESSVGGPCVLPNFPLAARRTFSENPRSS